MTPEKVQELWEAYCGELIDDGDKTSEDVRQALATFLRGLTDCCEGYYGAKDYTFCMVNSRDLRDTADMLEEIPYKNYQALRAPLGKVDTLPPTC